MNAFEGRAVVFDGPDDFHHRIDDPAENIDTECILFMRGAGPIGYPGGAEVVNMRPPAYLLKKGVEALPCIGDGRQSGTSGSPSILNASPEAADGGGLALLQTGDRVRIDLNQCSANMLVTRDELSARARILETDGYAMPESQSPWQQYFREKVGPFDKGMVLKDADNYQDIARKFMPRDNH
jgi:dihydroxy-acid dehydratase